MKQGISIQTKLNIVTPYVALIFLTFFTSLVLVSNPFSEVIAKHDSSMFTYFGYAMDNGKMMYTEIFDHKGPIIFIFNYIGILFSTTNFTGIYIIEFLSLFLFFLFTYKLSKLWIPDLTAFIPLIVEAIVLTLFLEGGNLTEEYALPFIAYSLYAFSKFYKSENKIIWNEIILIGMTFSIVFLLRANMISLWAIFCIFIVVELIYKKEYKNLFKVIGLFIIGVLLVFIPIGLYLYLNNALEAGIFQSLVFNFMYLDSSGEKNESVRIMYNILSNHYVVALFSVFLLYIIYKWRNYTKSEKLLAIGALLFSILSFYTSVMSGREYKHYLMAMVPTMTIPLIFIIKDLSMNIGKYKLFFSSCLVIFILYNSQLITVYETIYITNIDANEIEQADGINHKEQQMIYNATKKNRVLDIAKIIKENSNKDDTIYVHRNAGNLYLLSDRLSSIKYFNLPAVDLNRNTVIGEDFLKEIIHADSKLIILDTGFNNKEKVGTELTFYKFVLENYELIYNENGYFVYSALK